jgi:hypothetical protein
MAANNGGDIVTSITEGMIGSAGGGNETTSNNEKVMGSDAGGKGTPSNNENVMGDDAGGGGTIPTSFTLQSLPIELQTEIFIQSLRKPSLHFMNARKLLKLGDDFWSVTIGPLPKKTDPSGYRYLQELRTVCKSAYVAVRIATLEDSRLNFRVLKNKIDASTDLVCVKFQQPPRGVNEMFVWHPYDQTVIPHVDGQVISARFKGIRRIALPYKSRQNDCVGNYTNAFHCLEIPEQCQHLSQLKYCPREVAGFLDCVPDIQTLYIIIFPLKEQAVQASDRYYHGDKFKSMPSHLPTRFLEYSTDQSLLVGTKNPDVALESFYDSETLYAEVHKNCCTHGMTLVREAMMLLKQVERALRAPDRPLLGN